MKVFSRIANTNGVPSSIVPVLCPACRREGNFQPVGNDMTLAVPMAGGVRVLVAGQRLCPNKHCATHVFIIYEPSGNQTGTLVCSYPVGRIDFDASGVPPKVKNAFDEALNCAANECYVAAGMLIRKTLEAVCDDRAATGSNLKDRIADLRNKVTLPNELFEAMDHLRLLGNDAAHIRAQSYDAVGKEEVAAGVELAKEIVKATYQYSALVGKLKALQKP